MSKTETPTDIQKAVDFYREKSEVATNGVRKIPKGILMQRMSEAHGVSEDDFKKVQDAVDHETTVAAHVALSDLEDTIKATPKDKLADDEFRQGLSATVRLPTFGGSTEVTTRAETVTPIPGRLSEDGEPGERTTKLTYGRTRTTINTKARIDKPFHEEAANRLRKSLGIKD